MLQSSGNTSSSSKVSGTWLNLTSFVEDIPALEAFLNISAALVVDITIRKSFKKFQQEALKATETGMWPRTPKTL